MYAGLVAGKMDQKAKLFRVTRAASRDVALSEVPAMALKLKNWADTAENLVAALDQSREQGRQVRKEKKDRAQALENTVEDLKKSLKEDAPGGYDMDIERPTKRRGKRTRLPFGRRD